MTGKKTGTSAADAMNDAMASMARMQAAAMGPLNWMGPASMEAFQTTVQEVSSFVSHRIQKDMETQRRLLECKTLEEVQAIQSDALREAFNDYRAETERLSGIARDFIEGAATLPGQGAPGKG